MVLVDWRFHGHQTDRWHRLGHDDPLDMSQRFGMHYQHASRKAGSTDTPSELRSTAQQLSRPCELLYPEYSAACIRL